MTEVTDRAEKKRKLQEGPELEIDVSAPEPKSKKELRKAKKSKTSKTSKDEEDAPTEKPDSNETTESQPAPEKRSDYGIWIGNLAFQTTKEDLRNFIVQHCSFSDATITRVHMPKGPEKFGRPQNKGFAYVDFSTKKALDEALTLSEELLTGRKVLIKNAKSFEGRPEKSKDDSAPGNSAKLANPPSRRIFVGNLSFDVTKESLEEHFSRCGTLTNVHIATFQDTGKCKGYAWVEFEEIAAAEAAVRGFVMVKEDDEEEEESDDSSDSDSEKEKKRKKMKKPQQRKIWVNQLLGRRMRMEFAEDATTRYKKRFGKDGEGKKSENGASEDSNDDKPWTRKPKKQEVDESRYSKETVQRLSGAIVEGQGKKVTFD
ncbi:hypothetical protein N7532_001315 [Penicillium argentinense]|uniref:RRM domain-containing protein n=1 Tax=Penicillium argentinense TaxID=1131581 RepID=A0A9W9G343_9EURO|nr:uncharacterized protein N7532_001315 [Penicillium argentinense]KAJ5110780.1 hypothetical protein N7532_001315 [Penicillium argentinense]